MPTLLQRPRPTGGSGLVHRVTPHSAGWRHVGFEVHDLAPGDCLAQRHEGEEACIVLLSGKADITAGDRSWSDLGARTSVFEDKRPYSVYAPPGLDIGVTARTAAEVAVCLAPATGRLAPRLIGPDAVKASTRGTGTNSRHVFDILPETEPAEGLLVVEVITPGGCWSSYPSHKHDTDDPPRESQLEETYYHRIDPEQGFAVQRVYTEDGSIDETMCVQDRDVVRVPRGYHPCGAAHGYDLYYLNVMAGPKRIWKFSTQDIHRWLLDP